MTAMTEVAEATRRTKRRYSHELFPNPEEGEVRPLAVEVPYLYARMVGFNTVGTSWIDAEPKDMIVRINEFHAAAHMALLADALHQGMTGDAAWQWAVERTGDDMEWPWERAVEHGVLIDQIKPYPCGPTPTRHDHYGEPDARGWRRVTLAPGAEDDCLDCTELIVPPEKKESTDA